MAHDQLVEAMVAARWDAEPQATRWANLPERIKRAEREHMRAALDAIDAAGFVVMPKEPTAEMVAYAREAHIARVRRKVRDGTVGLDPDGTLVEQYRAMLRGRHPLAYEEADE